MSNQAPAWRRWMEGAATALFPQQCFACGVASGSGVLCRACFSGLPGTGAARCPVCAIPQPLGETCGNCLRHPPSMAALPVPQADLVMPMPLHSARLASRGFNQAAELARPLAKCWGLPVLLDGIVRDVDTRPQASLPWKERTANVRGAFRVAGGVEGLRVVVVDDVMTTGATLAELARTLKDVGAVSVENRVVARTPAPA